MVLYIDYKIISIPCPQKGGKFYPILLHKFITHRTGKIYLLFPDGLYRLFYFLCQNCTTVITFQTNEANI